MVIGNHLHDNVTKGQPTYFSVPEATPFLTNITGNMQLEDSLDLSITTENPAVPQSALPFYLTRLTQEDNLAAVIIVNGKTISLVGQNQHLIVMDSHHHSCFGAMIGTVHVNQREELMQFVKQQLSPHFNLCSLTFVKYL